MKRWLLIPLGVVVAVVVWFTLGSEQREAVTTAIGLTAPTSAPKLAKPICASPVSPNVAAPTDCIPQHLAKLPPDPGEAGKLTIDGIDSNQNGIRDDVERWIAQNWGHSEKAVAALTTVAKVTQMRVHYGDSLGKEETRKRMADIMRASTCYMGLATPEMEAKGISGVSQDVRNRVTNTPERWKRSREFDYLLAHNVYDLPDLTVAEACGFDPEKLSN